MSTTPLPFALLIYVRPLGMSAFGVMPFVDLVVSDYVAGKKQVPGRWLIYFRLLRLLVHPQTGAEQLLSVS